MNAVVAAAVAAAAAAAAAAMVAAAPLLDEEVATAVVAVAVFLLKWRRMSITVIVGRLLRSHPGRPLDQPDDGVDGAPVQAPVRPPSVGNMQSLSGRWWATPFVRPAQPCNQ